MKTTPTSPPTTPLPRCFGLWQPTQARSSPIAAPGPGPPSDSSPSPSSATHPSSTTAPSPTGSATTAPWKRPDSSTQPVGATGWSPSSHLLNVIPVSQHGPKVLKVRLWRAPWRETILHPLAPQFTANPYNAAAFSLTIFLLASSLIPANCLSTTSREWGHVPSWWGSRCPTTVARARSSPTWSWLRGRPRKLRSPAA